MLSSDADGLAGASWNSPKRAPLLVAAFSLLLPLTTPGFAAETGYREVKQVRLSEDTVWEGDYLVTGEVNVVAGASLVVTPGSRIFFRGTGAGLRINGRIVSEGLQGKRILFSAAPDTDERWGGIVLQEAEEGSVFSFSSLRGAKTAVSLIHSSALIRNTAFEEDGVAVDVNMESTAEIAESTFRRSGTGVEVRLKSRVKVRNVLFEDSEKFSIAISTGAGGSITDSTFRNGSGVMVKQGTDVFLGNNTFSGCREGIIADQVKHDVRISGNRFDKGVRGIYCVNFSSPRIACCEFRGLKAGVTVNQFSNPVIRNSLFEKNERAVFARQKSNFPIEKNVFRDNRAAVYVDLSSYPVIRGNSFVDNEKDIVLGIYMSADWEEKVGSGAYSRRQAQQKGSRNLGGVRKQVEFPGEVDARHNWWGAATTAEMARLGPGGNVRTIEDYHDTHEVTYPEFGEGSYRLDRVIYDFWETAPVAGAGLLPDGCGDLSADVEKTP